MVHIFNHRPDFFGRPSFNICLLPAGRAKKPVARGIAHLNDGCRPIGVLPGQRAPGIAGERPSVTLAAQLVLNSSGVKYRKLECGRTSL